MVYIYYIWLALAELCNYHKPWFFFLRNPLYVSYVTSYKDSRLYKGYRLFAADGSDIRIPTDPKDTAGYFPGTYGQAPYRRIILVWNCNENTLHICSINFWRMERFRGEGNAKYPELYVNEGPPDCSMCNSTSFAKFRILLMLQLQHQTTQREKMRC